MRPSSKGAHRSWLLFEKVTQDVRLTLGDIGLTLFNAVNGCVLPAIILM